MTAVGDTLVDSVPRLRVMVRDDGAVPGRAHGVRERPSGRYGRVVTEVTGERAC